MKKNHKYKLRIAGAAMVVIVTGILMHLYGEAIKGEERQRAVANEIIRLHVVANSDSEQDQKLKLQVKETIVTYLRGEMKDAQTVAEARQAIRENLSEIEEIANEKMQKEGFDYQAKASLGVCYFPVKQYGDMTFLAGDYEALRVSLGKGSGKNWWCVMYPTLCFVDATYQVVPDSSKEKLKQTLTQEEYDSLLDGGEEVTYSFRILEWLKNIV